MKPGLNKTVHHSIEILKIISEGNGAPVSAYSIYPKLKIKFHALNKVCGYLCKAKLIKSFRGAGGGYIINKDDISIFDLIKATSRKSNYDYLSDSDVVSYFEFLFRLKMIEIKVVEDKKYNFDPNSTYSKLKASVVVVNKSLTNLKDNVVH